MHPSICLPIKCEDSPVCSGGKLMIFGWFRFWRIIKNSNEGWRGLCQGMRILRQGNEGLYPWVIWRRKIVVPGWVVLRLVLLFSSMQPSFEGFCLLFFVNYIKSCRLASVLTTFWYWNSKLADALIDHVLLMTLLSVLSTPSWTKHGTLFLLATGSVLGPN